MTKYQYGRPKKRILDQDKIKSYLNKTGFEVDKISQEWRHLLAFGKFLGKEAVFKMASTQTTAVRTQNEYNWNDAVNRIDQQHPNLTVPKNYSFGYCQELFYFIAERFQHKLLTEPKSKNIKKLAGKITQIAQVTREVQTLNFSPACAFSKSKSKPLLLQLPLQQSSAPCDSFLSIKLFP